MPNRLTEMMEKNNKSVEHVADASGVSIDYIYRIRNPKYKERLNEDIIKPIADAVGCYPSELLPLEWQKPSTLVNQSLLTECIENAIIMTRKDPEYTPENIAVIAIELYNNNLLKKTRQVETPIKTSNNS